MNNIYMLAGLVIIAVLLNLPFGYLRGRSKKFSWQWFLYIHLPIPIIIFLRVKASFDWRYIPFLVVGSVVGQLLGAMVHRKRVKTENADEITLPQEQTTSRGDSYDGKSSKPAQDLSN